MSERLSPPEKLTRGRLRRKLGGFALRHAIDQPRQERLVFTESWWNAKYKDASELMAERAESAASRVLLVIAAQHPLIDGRTPNAEFQARLLAGIERARYLTSLGVMVDIYIPGSRHMDQGVVDDIPLAEAGQVFIDETGQLPPGVTIHGMDLNDYYKGESGVYNSGDEAFVSASYFKDMDVFGHMEVILSPGQQERWKLHAVANGVSPRFHGVQPADGQTYHNEHSSTEAKVLAYTRYVDPTWQGPHSFMSNTSRLLRKPLES